MAHGDVHMPNLIQHDSPFLRSYREDDGSLLDSKRMRGSGYGLIRFHKPDLRNTFESWPLYPTGTDPRRHSQHPGWPQTSHATDNYAREPLGRLPRITVEGQERPAVRVIEEATGKTMYARRLIGKSVRLHVFSKGPHTVVIGELGGGRVTRVTGLEPNPDTGPVRAVLPEPDQE